jgi:hypothetical protein
VERESKLTEGNLKGLVDAAIEIGHKRHDILQRMRSAFECGDNTEALRLGRELCGFENEEKSDRAGQSV